MEIKGQGFSLRGWKVDDAAALQKHADNINVSSYLFNRFPYPYTMDNAIEWISYMMKQDPLLNFVIDVDGTLAGVIGLDMRNDVYQKAPLMGYWLGETYWGSGIMPQAVRLMVNYAFTQMDIVRLQAGVFSNNPRSMRVLEKAGFVKEGILKSAIIKYGVILDEHIYGLVNRD
jgi:ribosomal-protein-alanine N-acetyltransferase